MEIIAWIIISYIVYSYYSKKNQISQSQRNIYACTAGAAALGMFIFFRLLLKVDHLSIWFLLAFAALSAQAVYTMGQWLFGKMPIKQMIIPTLKSAAGGGILLFFFYNLGRRVIGIDLGGGRFMPITVPSATILTLLGTALWIYGSKFLKKVPSAAYAVYIGVLTVTPILLFFIMELSWNDQICNIIIFDLLLNCLIYALLEVIFINIGKRKLIGLRVLYVLVFVVGAVNYFVVNFRGQPIMVSDISSVWTAMAVAGQYQFQMWDGIASAGIIFYLAFALLSALAGAGAAEKKHAYSKMMRPAVSLVTLAAFVIWTSAADFSSRYEIFLDFWDPQATYKTAGFAPGFISFMQKVKMEQPEGYSPELAEGVLQRYDTEKTADTVEQPTIIAIMNETFSDLSALGPLECTKDNLSYFYSLQNDPNILEFGYNYVSTRGGGTSTTEFEFLTGSSMSQIPGVNPYAVFNFASVPSLVQELKAQGYHTVAMHPENPRNWRRNVVYPALGFDEFLSIDAFEGYDRTVWNRVSDYGDYQKLIEVYEAQDSPAFIFNVTMQNHGGYDLNELPGDEWVTVDAEYSQYTDFQAYQSLIKKADDALRYLLDYFSQVDEPVLICFFGDHQPALNAEFESTLLESGRREGETDLETQQKYYRVPYFIWSNFLGNEQNSDEKPDRKNSKIDQQNSKTVKPDSKTEQQNRKEENSVVSTNYLGPLVLQHAGLMMSDYSRYLLAQREEIPVLNWLGYYAADGQWHTLEEENQYRQWIRDYSFVQYQALFDKKKDDSLYMLQSR